VRRETIATTLAILAVAAAIPFAIMEAIETGRVYLFSRQFLEELPRGFAGDWLMPERRIRPTFSFCSSVLDVERNCCKAEQQPSVLCSRPGSSWT
jgi:hypothetical protein